MNKIANFLLERSKKKSKLSPSLQSKNIKNVLVLTDKAVPPYLINYFPKVDLLFYSENKSIPKGNYQSINKTDFNWYGKIKEDKLKELLEKNYDLFIDFNSENNSFLNYLYRLIKADYKLSFKTENWADIILNNEFKNSEQYSKQITEVLKKF